MRRFFITACLLLPLACRPALRSLSTHSNPVELSPAWQAQGEDPNSAFGARVMAAGDVNGDGYGDLMVGAAGWKGRRGKASLFLGSPSGLGASSAWSLEGAQADELLGDRLGQAGDLNGDGFDDVF